jgi:hypothetical protein
MVWVRSLDAEEGRPVAGTGDTTLTLIWSPDSRFLAFVTGGKLKKIEAPRRTGSNAVRRWGNRAWRSLDFGQQNSLWRLGALPDRLGRWRSTHATHGP